MASKLELRFTDVGTVGASITIKTGMTYTFKESRLGFRQVGVGNNPKITPTSLAQNFRDAFNADDNFTGEVTVTYSATALDENGVQQTPAGTLDGILTLEHFDNTYFDGFSESAGFIIGTVSTTTQQQEANLTVDLANSPTDVCGKFLMNIDSNIISGKLTVEMPIGNVILDIPTSSLPYAFDRVRPATAKSAVVKVYETEFTGTPLKSVFFTAPGVLSLTDVKVSGSPFGAIINIEATGSNLEYSLDNIGFQGSKEWSGMPAGSHTAYVRDSYGCTKSLAFTVTEEDTQGLTAPPFVKVPIHNSLRFAERGGNTFLNFLNSETPSISKPVNQYQEYLTNDLVRMQFKSSFASNRAFMYDCDGAETEIAMIKKSDNISRIEIYDGNYVNYDGRLAIYFDSGNTYNADLSQKGTHALSGLLPDWYQEGMYVSIEGIGATVIDRIVFDEDSELKYAVTLKSGIGEGLGKKITSIHTADPYEVYEFDINLLTQGNFLCKIDAGGNEFYSEPIRVSDSLSDKYLKVEWFASDNNDILYGTGIRHMRRIPWSTYFTYMPKSEKETFYSDTTLGIVSSKSHATYKLGFRPMPMELARGLDFGFNAAKSKIIVNGAVFVCDGNFEAEPFGSLYKVSAELTLADQSMKGAQEANGIINSEFLVIEQDVNGIKFLKL